MLDTKCVNAAVSPGAIVAAIKTVGRHRILVKGPWDGVKERRAGSFAPLAATAGGTASPPGGPSAALRRGLGFRWYDARMKRTTISLPAELAVVLEREARRRSISVSAIVRQVLAAYLGIGESGTREIPFANLGASGYRDTARRVREILADEWGGARDT